MRIENLLGTLLGFAFRSTQPCMIKFNETLQRDQVSFISSLGGRPSLQIDNLLSQW
jgi:hypothetical protein